MGGTMLCRGCPDVCRQSANDGCHERPALRCDPGEEFVVGLHDMRSDVTRLI